MKSDNQIVLDINGQICPSCLLLTLKELNRVGAAVRDGSTEIVVLTDDRQATSTIPEAVDKMGYTTEVSGSPAGYRIRVFARR
ncbi:tRNA methyltransferase [Thioalkalivibrio denitrificans]|uniref:tRNA methyltransferase n=2 Tax=Thioalkalivibrio denitrificans TaxID=108003 RepID=A0A1V3NJZ3_9GAMM|nr:tRNA methyltransferase [Thioalkalivibrio denitrificans]